jgi:hypothetical protein
MAVDANCLVPLGRIVLTSLLEVQGGPHRHPQTKLNRKLLREKILAASGFAADRCGNQLVTPARSTRRLQPLRFDVRGSSCLNILPIFELNLWVSLLAAQVARKFFAWFPGAERSSHQCPSKNSSDT